MSNAADLQMIEVSIDEARKAIEKRDALLRLLKNRDFKKLVLTEYFENEPKRLATLVAHPNFQSDEQQKSVMEDLRSIGTLQQFFNMLRVQGDMNERAIKDHEEEREALLQEGDV